MQLAPIRAALAIPCSPEPEIAACWDRGFALAVRTGRGYAGILAPTRAIRTAPTSASS